MTEPGQTHRQIELTRTAVGEYVATNARGGTIRVGSGDGDDFSPVELLLVALAGCSAVDVDLVTSRRCEPDRFTVVAAGEKVRDEDGSHLDEVAVTFEVTFPAGADGDAARSRLPQALRMSHERLCTVSRTVERATPVQMRLA